MVMTADGTCTPIAEILTPLSIVQKLAFAPTDYGAPIVRGVIQSMCAV